MSIETIVFLIILGVVIFAAYKHDNWDKWV